MLPDIIRMVKYPECLWNMIPQNVHLGWWAWNGTPPCSWSFSTSWVFNAGTHVLQRHVAPSLHLFLFLWKTILLSLFLYFLWSASCTLAVWVLKSWMLCKTKTGQWCKSYAALHWKQGQQHLLWGLHNPQYTSHDNFKLTLKQVLLFLSLSPLPLLSAWDQDYIQYPLQAAVTDSVIEPEQMCVCSCAIVITGSKYIETNATSPKHDSSTFCMFYAVSLRSRVMISTELSAVIRTAACPTES